MPIIVVNYKKRQDRYKVLTNVTQNKIKTVIAREERPKQSPFTVQKCGLPRYNCFA